VIPCKLLPWRGASSWPSNWGLSWEAEITPAETGAATGTGGVADTGIRIAEGVTEKDRLNKRR